VTTGTETKKKRVVSGMRPTGRMHIGNYFGALENWARLQTDPSYERFYFIADWHSLTSDYADTSRIAQNVIEMATDYLAGGLDPAKSTIFLQSLVPEHAELHLLLSMVTPLGWLERVPTYKEALENVKDKDLHNYGFLGYPVLQCADITIYSAPDIAGLFVPVGEDQVSHVEASREIVRRFNFFYGFSIDERLFERSNRESLRAAGAAFSKWLTAPLHSAATELTPIQKAEIDSELRKSILEGGVQNFVERAPTIARFFHAAKVLTEPEAMLTQTPRIPGTDGRKMSKSYGNAIMLSESNENIWEKVRPMKTDPARIRRTDKGDPDKCPVYDWHKLFSPKETLDWAAHGCRTAEIGCIDCKKKMVEHLVQWITPVRERRLTWEKRPGQVLEMIDDGSKRARVEAQKTMQRVREAVFHWKDKRREIGAGDPVTQAADFLLDMPRKVSPND